MGKRFMVRGRASAAKRVTSPLDAVIYYVQRTAVLNKIPFCDFTFYYFVTLNNNLDLCAVGSGVQPTHILACQIGELASEQAIG